MCLILLSGEETYEPHVLMMNNAHLAENKFSNGTKANEKTKHTSAAKTNQLRIQFSINIRFQCINICKNLTLQGEKYFVKKRLSRWWFKFWYFEFYLKIVFQRRRVDWLYSLYKPNTADVGWSHDGVAWLQMESKGRRTIERKQNNKQCLHKWVKTQ